MAHFDYVQGPSGVWNVIDVPTAVNFTKFDQNLFKCLNADEGGSWAPSSAIVIGGQGLWLDGGAPAQHKVSGASTVLAVTTGGAIKAIDTGRIRSATVGGFQLGAGSTDWPTFTDADGVAAPRSRFLMQLPHAAAIATGWVASSIAFPNLIGPATNVAIYIPCNRLHNGATLTNVKMIFTVGQAHANVPLLLPGMRLWRKELDVSDSVTLMNPGAYPYVPASGAAWYNSGNAQAIDFPITVANVINTNSKGYVIELVDENGTNALSGNHYMGFEFTFTAIPNLAWQ